MSPRRTAASGELWLAIPWQVSVVLAAASFFVLHQVLPQALAETPLQTALAMLLRGVAWVPATLLSVVAVLVYLRKKKRTRIDAANPRGPARNHAGRRKFHDVDDVDDADVRDMYKMQGREDMRNMPDMPEIKAIPAAIAPPSLPPSSTDIPTIRLAHHRPAAVAKSRVEASGNIDDWSVESLRELAPEPLRRLCLAYYDAVGFTVDAMPYGLDGGADAALSKDGVLSPLALVECMAADQPVEVGIVRAFGGVLLERNVKRGVFWSPSGYAAGTVHDYAGRAGIQLLDGPAIVARLAALEPACRARLLAQATGAESEMPGCLRCGTVLTERKEDGAAVWTCKNAPACKTRLIRPT